MLIVCPSCASGYSIDDDKIGAEGRMVRCAGCRTAFFVTLADDQTGKPRPAARDKPAADAAGTPSSPDADAMETTPAIDQAALDAMFEEEMAAAAAAAKAEVVREATMAARARRKAPAKKAHAPKRPGLSRPLAMALGAAAASLLIIAGAVWRRDEVVKLAPASATLFRIVGLTANPRGLAFAELRPTVITEGEARFLIVEGAVRNLRGGRVAVPLIEISVRGEDGRPLYNWTTEPPRANLNAGESLNFRARLATPPEAGRHVEVRFADRAAGAAARS